VKRRNPTEKDFSRMEDQGALLVGALLRPNGGTKDAKGLKSAGKNGARAAEQAVQTAALEKAETKAALGTVAQAKKEAKTAEKFTAFIRVETKTAKTEWKIARKESRQATRKAGEDKERIKIIGAERATASKNSARIAKQKAKVAKHMYQVQRLKLKTSIQKSRIMSSATKSALSKLARLKAKRSKAKAEAAAARAELKEERTRQAGAKAKELRKKVVAGLKQKMEVSERDVKRFKRQAVRNKARMKKYMHKTAKKGTHKDETKFTKYKELWQKNQAGIKQRGAEYKAARTTKFKREAEMAHDIAVASLDVVADVHDNIKEIRGEIKRAIHKVRQSTRKSKRLMAAAIKSGKKAPAEDAQDALEGVKRNVKDQRDLETQLESKRIDLRHAQAMSRLKLRKAKEAAARLKPKADSEKRMERDAMAAEKSAAEASEQSMSYERIMRAQAKINVSAERKQVRVQQRKVNKLRVKLTRAKDITRAASHRAERSASQYMVMVKAAGIADGHRVKRMSAKATARPVKLNKPEAKQSRATKAYDTALSALNKEKDSLRKRTREAYLLLKKKVKGMVKGEERKRRQHQEKAFKKDMRDSAEPKKFVKVAEAEVNNAKEALQQAEAMKHKGERKMLKLRHLIAKPRNTNTKVSKNAVKQIAKIKAQAPVWDKGIAQQKKRLKYAQRVLESRRHLANAAVAEFKRKSTKQGTANPVLGAEIISTKKLMKGIEKTRAARNATIFKGLVQMATDVSEIAMNDEMKKDNGSGGSNQIEKIMNKAIKAGKKGAALQTAAGYVSKKLNKMGWNSPTGMRVGEEGYTKDMYDVSQIERERQGVAAGLYGNYAREKLKLLERQIDDGLDPGEPRKGMSRHDLIKSSRANTAALRKARVAAAMKGPIPDSKTMDLDEVVNRMHRHSGMSRQQFHAAMNKITGRVINLGTTNADKRDRQRAAERVATVAKSFARYEAQMKAASDPERVQAKIDLARDLDATKASYDRGMKAFEGIWGGDDGTNGH